MSNEDKLVEDLYDSAAETYLDIVKRTNYIGPQWLLENLQDNFQTNELKILDLGCANGINIANLSKLNPSTVVTGVDISKQMIAEAQKTGLYKSLYHQGIDAGLAFSAASYYDMAIALGCLEFVNDLDFCLGEVSRVCKEGSHFYASFQRFEPDNPSAPRHMKSGEVMHFAYSTKEILTKLSQASFHTVSYDELIGYTGGVPCPYTFVIARKHS